MDKQKQLLFYFYPGQLISSPPNSSIIGVIGESVVLPCHVVADNIPEVFSVQWIFHELSQKITVSRYDGKNKMEKQDERFQGRTEFFHSEFRAGNMSLHLKNVRSSDKGSYTCVVSFNGTYHDVLIELQVADPQTRQHIAPRGERSLVPITVDPDCRVLALQVPGTPDVESNTSEPAGPNAPSTVPVLLGKEGFAAGKHYWEVEVGQQQDWVLGVLREKGREEEEGTLPGEDFWALHSSQGEIFSSKGHHRIAKQQMGNSVIGVLLDLEEGQVNFYDAEQMGIMVRMPLRLGKEPAEMFYPFLSKREGTLTPLIPSHPGSTPDTSPLTKGFYHQRLHSVSPVGQQAVQGVGVMT
uniref:Uncharacterized protein n=1 Tax=Aquila chrysaetos chrysaetos TaxID=223781 RepID=A0A663EYY6_AQUCH